MAEYKLSSSPSKTDPQESFSPVLLSILNSMDDKSRQTPHLTQSVSNTASFLVENENARWLAKRPLLKSFVHHILQLLASIEFHDMDSYIRELQSSIEDCMGTHRYRRALAGVSHVRQQQQSLSPQQHDGHSLGSSSNASLQLVINELNDRSAAYGGRFIWEENVIKRDDPTLRSLFRELAEKTNPGGNMLRAEAKQERLLDGYCMLRVRTQRLSIANSFMSIADSNSFSDNNSDSNSKDDAHKIAKFFDLFAINYFTSDSFFEESNRHSWPGRNTTIDVNGKQKRLFRPQPRKKDLIQLASVENGAIPQHKPHYLEGVTHGQSHNPLTHSDAHHEHNSTHNILHNDQLSGHLGDHIVNSFSTPALNAHNKQQHYTHEDRHSHSTSHLPLPSHQSNKAANKSTNKLSPSRAGQTARLLLQLKN